MVERGFLIRLTAHRWALPALALLWRQDGAKFVTLERTLGVPKESLTRTLQSLTVDGLVARAEGYGHPLRPEYVLTAPGKEVGRLADMLCETQDRYGLAPGDLGRWGLPALAVLRPAPLRFNALARALSPVTPRALSTSLAALAARDLVIRSVIPDPPIVSEYAVAGGATALARAAERLWRPA